MANIRHALPGCTTQEEFKSQCPGLVASGDGYVQDLKDMDFILSNAFGAVLEQKDMRACAPGPEAGTHDESEVNSKKVQRLSWGS